MNFLSVCSGIEAASCAWAQLGWRAVGFSEIEPFPCSLLAHRFPTVPNFGDMNKFQEWPDDLSVDLLCGGTPCQSFSVAGLRKGLADPRGNLMLTYGAIAAKYQPKWLVWENVPGVLSSNGGRDFGAFLGLLGELRYGFAYRILDAQYAGIPQRRRRVFVVGCLGDWRSAAAVLFERHSLSGHPAPRRESRKGVTGGARIGFTPSSFGQYSEGCGTLRRNGGDYGGGTETLIPEPLCVATGQAGADMGADMGVDMAPTLSCNHEAPYIAHTLRGKGFDAGEDGTGRGTPLVPVTYALQHAQIGRKDDAGPQGKGWSEELSFTQDSRTASDAVAIAFDCKSSGQNGFGIGIELAGTQRAMGHANSHTNGGGNQAVAIALRGRDGGATAELGDEVGYSLRASSGGGDKAHVLTAAQVRRLTPRECERLQGFPDDWTNVPHRGKPAADGPRYKSLGNSWAVPVAAWVGERINQVEAISKSMEHAA